MTMPMSALLQQALLAVLPHGLQHRARRNAYQATGVAAIGRREREAAEAAVAAVRRPVGAVTAR